MPIHAHDAAERLEPERMREPPQQLVAPVVMPDRLADDGAEPAHALAEPCRHAAAVQRQVGASGSVGHANAFIRRADVLLSFFRIDMSTATRPNSRTRAVRSALQIQRAVRSRSTRRFKPCSENLSA